MELDVTIVFQKNWEAIHALTPEGKRRYKYIINMGSSRSSKTVSLIDVLDLYARANANKRMTVWRDTKTDCKNTVFKDMEKRLKTTGRYELQYKLNKTDSTYTYDIGSSIEISGTDESNKVHGLTQDVAWLNEPYDISRDTFDQIDQRTSDFILIDLNPKMGHWVDDIINNPRALVIHSTFSDNPFCPEEPMIKILGYQPVKYAEVVVMNLIKENDARVYDYIVNPLLFTEKQIRELARCIENERIRTADEFNWCVYGLGLKAEKPHRIFRWRAIADHVWDTVPVEPIYASDWGKVHPWGVVGAKYWDGTLYLKELNYLSENEIRAKLDYQQLAQITALEKNEDDDEAGRQVGLVKWYWNSLGISRNHTIVCDPNRTLKVLALRDLGYDYAIAAHKPPGSIADGISLVSDMDVAYTASSKNLEHEQENYSNKVDRYGIVLEEPEDKHNHLIDGVRYIAEFLRSEGYLDND